MKNSLSTDHLAGRLADAHDDDLKVYSWCFGLLMCGMETDERACLLDALLTRALDASKETRAWVIEQLAQHVEDMSAETQVKFIRAYQANGMDATPECDCKLDFSETLARLSRRLKTEACEIISESTGCSATFSTNDRAFTQAQIDSTSDVLMRPRGEPLAVIQNVSGDGNGDDQPTIALVTPEFLSANTFLQPPLEMLLAATRLREAGYRVILVDNRVESLSLNALAERVAGASVIVVTTTPYDHIQNYFLDYRLSYAFKTINSLKDIYPEAKLVVCGAHGTVRPDIVFRDTRADVILKGEFDTGIVPLVDGIFRGANLSLMPEVCLRESEGAKRPADSHGGQTPYKLVELGSQFTGKSTSDDGLLPAYDLIDLDDYYGDVYVDNRLQRRKRWATMLATRGCAHDCTFCFNFWGRRVRYRDPESVVRELEWLQNMHQASHVFFIDFHFSQDPDWVMQFCELVRRKGLHIGWSAQVRCDAVPLEMLREMAAANCSHLWFGVESFDPYMVSSMGKYQGVETAFTALENCREAGIEPHLFIMIGLPGETRETINTTIARMHAAKASYCGVMIATPRFGTKYYEVAKQQFPQLGSDFYSLRSVRGLIANDLDPLDLQEAMAIFDDRDFIYQSEPPQLKTVRVYQ